MLLLKVQIPPALQRGLAYRPAIYEQPLVEGRRLKQAPFQLRATKQLLRLPPVLDLVERELNQQAQKQAERRQALQAVRPLQ